MVLRKQTQEMKSKTDFKLQKSSIKLKILRKTKHYHDLI